MAQSNLHGLAAAGVSVWSDQISREMLDSGELERRIVEDAVTGVTSNPSIFEAAIVDSSDYDEEFGSLLDAGTDADRIVKTLMAADLNRACDLLLDVHRATDGTDGYVSVEVSPTLANDTDASVAEARDWAKQISKPNLLVKVPATPEGVPAIEQLIGEGISINVTLIFSLQRYREVMDAYISGLETFAASGGDISKVFSVGSFFVSRVDSEVDRRLEDLGSDEALELRGTAAVANAQAAFGDYLEAFSSERFQELESEGARRQKPLWASTSTKNPEYSDLLYVESLVAPGSVNTMPIATIEAYQDHGDPDPEPFTSEDIELARVDLARLQAIGVDYADVVQTLEDEGVKKFAASWQELLDKVAAGPAAGSGLRPA
ncbi:MAG: transaldolase [Acidimicrobiia bacterium]